MGLDLLTGVGSKEHALGEFYAPATAPPPLPGHSFSGLTFYARDAEGGPEYVNRNLRTTDPLFLRLAYLRAPLSRRNLARLLNSVADSVAGEGGLTRGEYSALAYLSKNDQGPSDQSVEEALTGSFLPFHSLQKLPHLTDQRRIEDLWGVYQHMARSVCWAFGRGPAAAPPMGFSQSLAAAVGVLFQSTNQPHIDLRYDHRRPPDPQEGVSLPTLRAQFFMTGEQPLWEFEPAPVSVGLLAKEMFDLIGAAGAYYDACPNCGRVFRLRDLRQVTCSTYCRKALSRKKHPRPRRNQEHPEAGQV